MKRMFICLTLISLLIFPSFADSSAVVKPIDTDGIELTRVENLPAGIVPIKINSQKEFDEFINAVNNNSQNLVFDESNDFKYDDSTLNNFTVLSKNNRSNEFMTASNHTSTNLESVRYITPATFLKLCSSVNIYNNGSFRQINSVNSWTVFTGVTTGMEWQQSNIVTNISDDKQSVRVEAFGVIKYYVMINGFINYYTGDGNVVLNYSL